MLVIVVLAVVLVLVTVVRAAGREYELVHDQKWH